MTLAVDPGYKMLTLSLEVATKDRLYCSHNLNKELELLGKERLAHKAFKHVE